MSDKVHIVDLFAGPGGLGEGFSSYEDEAGKRPFKLVASVEVLTELLRYELSFVSLKKVKFRPNTTITSRGATQRSERTFLISSDRKAKQP